MAIATRGLDRTVLDWVQRRAAGQSTRDIAAQDGVRETLVRTATNRVLSADLAESGEAGAIVEASYWPRRRRRGGAA